MWIIERLIIHTYTYVGVREYYSQPLLSITRGGEEETLHPAVTNTKRVVEA
jgi:hypothetical protein